MKLKAMLTVMMAVGLGLTSMCWADGYGFSLRAGSTSVAADGYFKRDLNTGYLKTGAGVVYTDDDDMNYQWLDLNVMVGSEFLAPGLTCEIGLAGLFGDAEDGRFSGDVGAIAFSGRVAYLFDRSVMPIPLELFATLDYAPEILSLRDTKKYTAYSLGAGLQIVENATIFLEFASYDLEMEDAPTDWDLDDSVVRLGIRMRF